MDQTDKPETPAASSDREGRRRFGRLKQDTLACNLGPVLDLSAGGMRVRCRTVPEGDVEVILYEIDRQITVQARVAWSRKAGLLKREIGLVFLDADDRLVRKLTRLAMNNRVRQTMWESGAPVQPAP